MTNRRPLNFPQISLAGLLLGLIWIVFSTSLPTTNQSAFLEAPQSGFKAPSFQLESLSGESYSLQDLEGQPVVINFWASWCGPCRQEMPALQKVYETYQAQGLVVLAVNTSYNDSIANAKNFVEEAGLTFPILLDREGRVSELYHLQATPTTFFIAPDGRIRELVLGGPMAEALLETRIEQLFKEDN